MGELEVVTAGQSIMPGEAYLGDTPALRSHAGMQPDLFLRWNAIPLATPAVDAVVYLHGFSQQREAMLLAEKVAGSGLDLAGRKRPTIALLPRGNWLRYTWYDFPALLAGGIDRLVEYGMARFARAAGRDMAVDRFILAAHSGGGMPAIDAIAGATRRPDEFYVFDGLYGRDPAGGDPMGGVETVDRWFAERLECEPGRQGALRVVYIEQQTGRFSRKVGELVSRRLAAVEPAVAEICRRRYRVEVAPVQHAQIARRCLPDLLAEADVEFDWRR
jgi:pimeloyl-ACP methyl ester carboxylesterase